MIAGKDFPDAFTSDTFSQRRNHGSVGNAYNPESLITYGEIAAGMTYLNSRRDWPTRAAYDLAVQGLLSVEDIIRFAPRVLIDNPPVPARSDWEYERINALLDAKVPRLVMREGHGPRAKYNTDQTYQESGLDLSKRRIRPGFPTKLPRCYICGYVIRDRAYSVLDGEARHLNACPGEKA